ncbi:acid-sensing ion channel 1-like [Hydra vulgaris]|uniref:Acid-sensing ion channel 1-like n=1 Tax=Hydra vulgaris TaxID=6087 RepID=A0A0A0MP61_HYDVU|nr:acid-sensing ion channel 1-like [Hydra vulgaris]CDG50531.1 Hydra sodium channel 10 [Hydra vulgaris]
MAKVEDKIKSPQEQKRRTIKQYLAYAGENISIHGLSHVFDKRENFICRTVWLLITIAAFGYAVQKVYESTLNYFSYPFSTARMKIHVNQMDFPAVSFCNLNDFRYSATKGTKLDKAILSNDKKSISGEEYLNITLKARHKIEEMLVDCEFDGNKCSVHNFTEFNWNQGELCFTFNSGKFPHSLLKVNGVGMKRSLVLTINVQHYEYYGDELDAGIHLILHDQEETPIKKRGPVIPPGFTTYIQVEKKTILNLESPYKTKCGSIKLKYFDSYSMHTCWLEQLTDHVYKICKCKDFFMPGEIKVCSFEVLENCTWKEWAKFDNYKLHTCPLPCKIDSYEMSLSRALFPTARYASSLANRFRKLPHVLNTVKSISNDLLFMRENLLRVVIYYNDLSYELLEQKPNYDTLVWLGDVGGQIGLFVGAGVMSYFEIIDCLVLIIYTRFFQKFKTINSIRNHSL